MHPAVEPITIPAASPFIPHSGGKPLIQISKFVWAITSCGGRPTIDVFAHHYKLHYQNKKIHLEGSKTTFVVQFGCITFHLS
jgi:hypothetical protein